MWGTQEWGVRWEEQVLRFVQDDNLLVRGEERGKSVVEWRRYRDGYGTLYRIAYRCK
jgi:hypothetical protein